MVGPRHGSVLSIGSDVGSESHFRPESRLRLGLGLGLGLKSSLGVESRFRHQPPVSVESALGIDVRLGDRATLLLFSGGVVEEG